jgi:hypothetical protein
MTENPRPDLSASERIRKAVYDADTGDKTHTPAGIFRDDVAKTFNSFVHDLDVIANGNFEDDAVDHAIRMARAAQQNLTLSLTHIKPLLVAYAAVRAFPAVIEQARKAGSDVREISNRFLREVENGMDLGVLGIDRVDVGDRVTQWMIDGGIPREDAVEVGFTLRSLLLYMQQLVRLRDDESEKGLYDFRYAIKQCVDDAANVREIFEKYNVSHVNDSSFPAFRVGTYVRAFANVVIDYKIGKQGTKEEVVRCAEFDLDNIDKWMKKHQ